VRVLIVAEAKFNRGALAAARALRGAGWAVGIGSSQPGTLASRSRSISWHHRVPTPYPDVDAFLQAVKEAVAEVGYDVVFPTDDAHTLALSFGRERFQASVPYPAHASVLRAFDKFELARSGERAGFAIPHTVLATEEAVRNSNLPVVVKARLHWIPDAPDGPRRWRTTICSTKEQMSQRVAEIKTGGGEPILQEPVDGSIMSLSVIVDGSGESIACVQQLGAPLTWRPGVGSRVRMVSVPVQAELLQKAQSFLRDMNWLGFANLQFMASRGREPLLIDFNSYLHQSFHHLITAGGNLPDLWARVATGKPLAPPQTATVGKRFHWLEGDLKRALAERRGGLVRDVGGCLLYAVRAEHGVWRWNDPWPAIWYWSSLGKHMTRKLHSERAAPS
jgi:predicted ATP-grasp superfamily ATP-dependent carboligase